MRGCWSLHFTPGLHARVNVAYMLVLQLVETNSYLALQDMVILPVRSRS